MSATVRHSVSRLSIEPSYGAEAPARGNAAAPADTAPIGDLRGVQTRSAVELHRPASSPDHVPTAEVRASHPVECSHDARGELIVSSLSGRAPAPLATVPALSGERSPLSSRGHGALRT